MTAFSPPKIASYDGVASVLDSSGRPLLQNAQGEFFPHASENFWKMPLAEQAKSIPPHLHQELLTWAQQQASRMSSAAPFNADPVAQPSEQTSKTDAMAKKALFSSSSHSFLYAGKKVTFDPTYSRKGSQGVSHSIKVSPLAWKQIESLTKKYLDQLEMISSKRTTEIRKIGFTRAEDGSFQFVAYVVHSGVLERVLFPVADSDLPQLRVLCPQYPGLIVPDLEKLKDRSLSLQGARLQDGLAFSTISQNLLYDSDSVHPIAKGFFEDAIRQARSKAKDHKASYTYINQQKFQLEEVNSALDAKFREFTDSKLIQIADRTKTLKNNAARVYHGLAMRAGSQPNTLSSDVALNLAQEHPLHFAINASLGHMDKEYAPQTKDFENVLIQTESNSFFSSTNKTALIAKQSIYDARLTEKNEDDAEAYILQSFLMNIRRYSQLQRTLSKHELITIHEPVEAKDMTSPEVAVQFFIPLLTQLALNTKAANPSSIKMNFEFPDEEAVVKVGLREILTRVQGFLIGAMKEEEPISCEDLINLFVKEFEIGAATEEDALSVGSES